MTVLPVPDLLARALDRRAGLPGAGTTFFRAVHITETGGLWTLDVAGDAGILSLYTDLSAEAERDLAAQCGEAAGLSSVYLKRRPPRRNIWRTWRARYCHRPTRCGARPAPR